VRANTDETIRDKNRLIKSFLTPKLSLMAVNAKLKDFLSAGSARKLARRGRVKIGKFSLFFLLGLG
jgi:hypothetical protein